MNNESMTQTKIMINLILCVWGLVMGEIPPNLNSSNSTFKNKQWDFWKSVLVL